MYTIYPTPGSYNDFCGRNPEITDRTEQLKHLDTELSMWRATSLDIDLSRVAFSLREQLLRHNVEQAISRGEEVLRLTEWPAVGDYEVPELLQPAA